ncbi:MAG: geranylgeranylglyceryl/heptaprenylglyceryl phosphate synthase [Salibacteraceae bacterium]
MVLPWLEAGAKAGKKRLAVLIDPDKTPPNRLSSTIVAIHESDVDLILVGGSLLVSDAMEATVQHLKAQCNVPVVIFPGSPHQISASADALLLLSLISGRNPDLLIGQHVQAAPALKRSGLELLPTGYLLINGGRATTVSYISNTEPIPADKPEIAAVTALAGTQLGLRLIYLDAGSGAMNAVAPETVTMVRQQTHLPLIIGGGIRNVDTALALANAGADMIVVGNAIEDRPQFLPELSSALKA